jgi:hypothetical protein
VSDPLDLEPIKARCAAATPGWWKASGDTLVANAGNGPWLSLHGWPRADRTFVEHARDDVPDLLAEVERLRARVEGLVATLTAASAYVDELETANAALAAQNTRFGTALGVIRDYILMTWTDFEALHPGLIRPSGAGPRFDIAAYAVAALNGHAVERTVTLALPAPGEEPPLLAAPSPE